MILEDVDEFWARRDGAARARDDVPRAYVHNLVGTARVDTNVLPIRLDLVGKMVPGMQYDKQKFAAITLRLAQPSCTVLLTPGFDARDNELASLWSGDEDGLNKA